MYNNYKMAARESLFSLEVIVESVDNIVVSSRTPAIAFRLLDFPTLVIRSKENAWTTSPGRASSYTFNAGKSCLFKINKDKLHTSLQSTPLYIMLVDIWAKNTKLLASTTISLSKCFENVLQSIERNGIDVPAVLGNKGAFELYNLMGTPVAVVRLNYRIFSLGGTISGHVNICKPLVKSPCQPEAENTRRNEKNERTVDERLVTQNSSEKIENHVSIFQIEVESQTDFYNKEQSIKSCIKQSRLPKSTIGKGYMNITRPPALYYNSQSSFMDSFIPVNSKSVGFTPEKGLVERGDNTVDIEEAMPRNCYRTVSVQTSTEVPDNTSKVHPEEAQRSNLPLINALLNELSLVKQNFMKTACTQLEQYHNGDEPQLAVVVNSQELRVSISQSDTKPPKGGVIKKCHLSAEGKIKKYATVKPPLHKGRGVLVRRNPMKFKKSLLTCGTTKTQRLREAFNKKSASCSNVSTGDAEARRPQITNVERGRNLVTSKNVETKEIACQVEITRYGIDENKQEIAQPLKGKKTNGTQRRHDRQALVVRDVGIQVISPDDNLFPTQQDDEYSDEDNRNVFDTNTTNYPPQVGDSNDIIQEDPKDLKSQKYQEETFHGSEVELSIRSMSCTAEELVSDKQLAFSNFPQPTKKNSRYVNDKHPDEELDKSSSIDIGLSKKHGLLGKSYSHSNSLSNSSFEHDYSQDNFDSFTSDQVAESIASDNLNTGMPTIGTNEQSDEK